MDLGGGDWRMAEWRIITVWWWHMVAAAADCAAVVKSRSISYSIQKYYSHW